MRRNIWLKVFIISCGLAICAGCSTTKNKTGDNIPVVDADQQNVSTQGLGDQDGIGDQANKMKAPYNQTYYFAFNKDLLQQDDIASLKVQAGYLVAHPQARVRIEGNADERGSREYNVALGWRRAKAAVVVLEQQGVSQKQIASLSYGKEKPVAFGHDEAAYHLNRRVNLIYEAK